MRNKAAIIIYKVMISRNKVKIFDGQKLQHFNQQNWINNGK